MYDPISVNQSIHRYRTIVSDLQLIFFQTNTNKTWRLVVSSFYFKIFIATLNSVYLKPLLLSVLFYRLNVYIYICFIMSKKKVIPRAYTVPSLNLTREIYIYIYVCVCIVYVCMCVLYKLHLTKKLKKRKILFSRYFNTGQKTRIFVTDK